MKMEKRKFRIGELAKILEVEQFVVRFWEKEFGIKSTRSSGGQRFYDEDDLRRFQSIKTLLYEQGFTIAGARKQLKARGATFGPIIASQKTSLEQPVEKAAGREEKHTAREESEKIAQQISVLQRKLVQLRDLL
jgi:DNA-binding transcriptional MerR regulator